MTDAPTTPFALTPLPGSSPLFQALVEHSADLILLFGRHGQLLYQNPSARRHLGWDHTPAPGYGHAGADALHPGDRERVARQVQPLPPGVTAALCPYRVRHADGSWRWLEGTVVNLLHDPQVRATVMQARDVTPRIQAQERAHALEALGTALAGANTTEEVVRVILQQGLPAAGASAGGVMSLDARAAQVQVLGTAGYPEATERPWRQGPLDLNTAAPATDALRQGHDLFLTREDWQVLYPHLRHALAPTTGGTAALLLRIGGEVIGALTLSFREAQALSETERQHLRTVAAQCALALERGRLNAQLRQQERHFRKLTEFGQDLVTIVALDGETRYVSPALQPMLGYTPEERLGLNVFEGIHPEDRERVMEVFQQAVLARGLPVPVTYRFQHGAGHWVWLESTGTNAAHDPDLRGVVINTRDITARVEAEQARRASERRLQLFEVQSDTLICTFTPQGTCLYASPATETLLGCSPDEFLTCELHTWVHPDDLPKVRTAWTARTALPAYRVRRRDGTFLWVQSEVRRVLDQRGTLLEIQVATRDITPRQRAEEAMRLQLRRFQDLVDLTAEFAVQQASESHLQTALERCLSLTPYTYGLYFPLDGSAPAQPLRAGQVTDELLARTTPLARAHRGGQIGRALRRHQPFFAGPDQPVHVPPEPLPRPVWTSLAILPVIAHGVLRGLMAFGTSEGAEIDDDTRRLLIGVSEQASRAVERSVHLHELERSREETLRALGLALEYRDYETKGHTDRVVDLTERLGRALGFTGGDLDALRWGAFLHDTGKVAIPDAILLKPGKLTPEEWEVIRRHPGIGYEMLHHIPSLPSTTLEVVLYHQERWNGSGYPRGLAGTDIPLAARVFAVIDVYDALTSERPYKRAWTHDEAAAQLRREAGVLLDGRVVQTFLQVFHPEQGFMNTTEARQ